MKRWILIFVVESLIFASSYIFLVFSSVHYDCDAVLFTPGEGDVLDVGYYNSTSSHKAEVSWVPAPNESHTYFMSCILETFIGGSLVDRNVWNRDEFTCNESNPHDGDFAPHCSWFEVEEGDKGKSGYTTAMTRLYEDFNGTWGQIFCGPGCCPASQTHNFTCDW